MSRVKGSIHLMAGRPSRWALPCILVSVCLLTGSPFEDSSDSDSEGEEPLVRCKRPICDVDCEFGFKKDASGCPTCTCLRAAETSLIGRPDGHEPFFDWSSPCDDRPMCRMYCEFGFKRDEDGCEICSCHSRPGDILLRVKC